MTHIYMDHNATTPVRPEVAEKLNLFLGPHYGNPNSIHRFGRQARTAVENAREEVATLIGSNDPQEIIFTSGGTESDNWALRGGNRRGGGRGPHRDYGHRAFRHTRHLQVSGRDGGPGNLRSAGPFGAGRGRKCRCGDTP